MPGRVEVLGRQQPQVEHPSTNQGRELVDILTQSGSRKSKIKVSAGLVLSEAVRDNLFQASPLSAGG